MPPKSTSLHAFRASAVPAHAPDTAAPVELLTRLLLDRVRLAVVFGGDKSVDGAVLKQSRNRRSWKSYEAVAHDIAAAMRRLGCRHIEVLPDDMRLPGRLRDGRIHMAWLNTGGVQGQNAIAHAASTLELLGIPYIGHDPLTAATLDNKFFFKRQLASMGLATAPFIVCSGTGRSPDPTRHPRFAELLGNVSDGYIVKPISGRASLHVHYVERQADLAAVAAEVYQITHNPVLVEAYLPGREYCIAVMGPYVARQARIERLARPFSFAAVERVLTSEERIFTSMDSKPITRERMRPLDRATDGDVVDRLEEIAMRLYLEFPLETLVRLDVRADAAGRLNVLEANPKPDLKAQQNGTISLIEAGLEPYGMTYDNLILSIFANRAASLLDDADGITSALERLIDR
jgi:D-alanine-D-alanine ligase